MRRIQPWCQKLAPCKLGLYLLLGFAPPAVGQEYLITDLNDPSDSFRLAHCINSVGEVVGEYGSTNLPTVGAFWHHHGTNTDLGLLAGYLDAYAHGINDSGQIVGWCDSFSGLERAFLYANGVMQNLGTLGTLPAAGYSEAYAINRSAQIVGTASLSDTTINHAVLWSGTAKKDLGTLAGPAYNSSAFAVNNSGVIVGESEVAGSIFVHAFSYSNNVMTDLLTLPGGGYSRANAINDAGVVVGESDTLIGAGFQVHAFVYREGLGMEDLGTLGGRQSSAYAINSAGQIVGYALNTNDVSRAFLYDGTKMVDLNDLIPPTSGWTNLEAAVGINDAGQIAGYGQFEDGVYHAFLLTPANSAAPVTISQAAFGEGSFSFSFGTQSGRTYTGQFSTSPGPGDTWQTFTNLVGTGSTVRVTDTTATNAERYYRVVAK
jgi:probable HAF family extracellular repeat protein